MGERHNAGGQNGAIRAGLISDRDRVAAVLTAASRSPEFRLVALSGQRPEEIPVGVEWYDDPRTLILQTGIDALIVTAPTGLAVEVSEIAAAHNLPVWRSFPLARSFAEATEAVRRQRDRKTLYRLSSWWEHVLEQYTHTAERLDPFNPYVLDIDVRAEGPSPQSWRSQQSQSGGGVLINSAYHILEALAAIRGLPETVSAAAGRFRRRAGETPRETEEFCSAVLRWADGGVASVRAAWDARPHCARMRLHASDRAIELSEAEVCVIPSGAAGRDSSGGFALPEEILNVEIAQFAAAIRGGRFTDPVSFERHLATVALIETIYLSAKTGQPETPRKLYEVQSWTIPPA